MQGISSQLVNLRSLYLECGFWRMCGHYATHELSRLTALTHLSFRKAEEMLVSHITPLYLITSLRYVLRMHGSHPIQIACRAAQLFVPRSFHAYVVPNGSCICELAKQQLSTPHAYCTGDPPCAVHASTV